jgi:hypothetical protein
MMHLNCICGCIGNERCSEKDHQNQKFLSVLIKIMFMYPQGSVQHRYVPPPQQLENLMTGNWEKSSNVVNLKESYE